MIGLGLAVASGVLIGLAYFGMLWWTVRRMSSARHPAALVAGSFLIRTVAAAAAIVLVSGGEWIPLLAVVAGFLVARTILIRVVGKPLEVETGEGRTMAVGEARVGGDGTVRAAGNGTARSARLIGEDERPGP